MLGQLLVPGRHLLRPTVRRFRTCRQLLGTVAQLPQATRQGLRSGAQARRAVLQGLQLCRARCRGFQFAQARAQLRAARRELAHAARQGLRSGRELGAAVCRPRRAAFQVARPAAQFRCTGLERGGPVAQLPGGVPDVSEALLHVGHRLLHHAPAVLSEVAVERRGQRVPEGARHAAGKVVGSLGHVQFQQAVPRTVPADGVCAEIGRNGQGEIRFAALHGGLRLGLGAVGDVLEFGVLAQFAHHVVAQVVGLAALGGPPVQVDEAHGQGLKVPIRVEAAAQVDRGVQQRRHGNGGGGEPHHGVSPQATFGGGQGLEVFSEGHAGLLVCFLGC